MRHTLPPTLGRLPESGMPFNLAQRWLGHAPFSTLMIYPAATGEEERHIALRIWDLQDQSRMD